MPRGLSQILPPVLTALGHILMTACSGASYQSGATSPPALIGAADLQIGAVRLVPTRNHAAGDDFYQFANNDWLKANAARPDRLSTGAIETVGEDNNRRVRELIENLIVSGELTDPTEQKIADLYISALDEDVIEARGTSPLAPHLSRIRAISDRDELTSLMGVIGYNSPIGLAIGPGPEDPDHNAIWLSQAGLGLPHRGYYIGGDRAMAATQEAYREYIADVLSLLGHDDTAMASRRVFELEKAIAEAHSGEDLSLTAGELMRSMSLSELIAFAPAFRWDLFLQAAGLSGSDRFVVLNQTAVRDISGIIGSLPLDDWKLWLEFSFASDFADYLPRAFSDKRFGFYSRRMSGLSRTPPRWEFAVGVVNVRLGDAVGQLYVQRYVPASYKQIVTTMVSDIRSAFEARLKSNSWMDEQTRSAALQKLKALSALIAYPDNWGDYSSYRVYPDRLFENVYASYVDTWNRQTESILSPVERRTWLTHAHAANAFYNPLSNSFVLPAGLLRYPFFEADADPAENFGGIGALIGHEISHAFDDLGRQFDASGRSVDWWTRETEDAFLARAQRLTEQYDAYCPLRDACVNGAATLGENIGDLAGLEIAYAAYRRFLGDKEAPVREGQTGDQRFFLAYARTFRELVHDEAARRDLATAGHAPGRYRVNGVVRNMDAWYRAFDVRPGDRLYLAPAERVVIW